MKALTCGYPCEEKYGSAPRNKFDKPPWRRKRFGLLKEELQELKEEINRRSSRRGFKDIVMFG